MNTKSIITFLYVPLKKQNSNEELNKIISQLAGVNRVTSNIYVSSIMDIEYDPQSISSSSIVRQIEKQGMRAALIAM